MVCIDEGADRCHTLTRSIGFLVSLTSVAVAS